MQERHITLTPNKRLARHLQNNFCKKTAKDQPVWQTYKILPIDSWLTDLWQEVSDPRTLLTSNQERLIWQKVLLHHTHKHSNDLITLLVELHALIHNWQIDVATFTNYVTEDILSGQHFYTLFKKYCSLNNLITHKELLTALLPHLAEFKFTSITFSGFDEYTPQLQIFITTLEQTGCTIIKTDPNQQQAKCQLIALDNFKQELITSATWAKQVLYKHPHCNIGIIIPNLLTLRPQVTDIFYDILGDNKKINISAGIPLSTLPIINCAYTLLTLEQPFTITTLTQLLLSPYLGGFTTEKTKRILYNKFLQQTTLLPLNLQELTRIAKKQKIDIPEMFNLLHQWSIHYTSLSNKQLTLSSWIKSFAQTLKLWGWPGTTNLSTLEAKAVKNFQHLCQEMSSTSLFLGKILMHQALKMFYMLIINTNIQPQVEHDAPINIVGLLEATGINFDYLWITNMDEEHWPTQPRPNPFIPHILQKKLCLPHSSFERELQFCNMLLARYKRSAQLVIFSYTKQLENRNLGPSRLLADIPIINACELNLPQIQTTTAKIYATKLLETISDTIAPPLQETEIVALTSRLIELQALCPFRAYTALRLHVEELQIPSLGISKKDRGIIIHQVLENFWHKTKTHANLCVIDTTELENILKNTIEQALTKLGTSKILTQLETKHLTSLLLAWLEIEKKRDPFYVIATEKSVVVKLANLPLRLRIDRIDQLHDGKKIIIDYKTGKNLPTIYNWFNARSQNLQLPLYSLAIENLAGLCLAQINATTLKCKIIELHELLHALQISEQQDNSTNINTWEKLVALWRDTLEQIANDFTTGKAEVNPISPQTCMNCSYDALCRKNIPDN